jgi:hypothetical protein
MKLPFIVWNFVALGLGITTAYSQTQVDLRTQSRNVDFTAAPSTKPIRTGGSLPPVCAPGEVFIVTSATPGQNLNLCTQANTWTVQGATSMPGASAADLGPAVTKTDAVTLSVGSNCSIARPCRARIGGVVYTYAATWQITLASGSPTIRVYLSDGTDGAAPGTLRIGNSTDVGVTCSPGCAVEPAQSAFPGMSIPLAIWTATTPGAWDDGGQDLRAALSTGVAPANGSGILFTGGNSPTLSIDSTIIPRKFGGSGSPGLVADSNVGDFYVDTLNNETYQCFSRTPCAAAGPGNWVKIVVSGGSVDTTSVPRKFSGPGAPGNVSGSVLGDFYLDTQNNDAYQCFSQGTCTAPGGGNWVKIDSGGGSGLPAVISGLYASYGGTGYFPLYTLNGMPDAPAWTWLHQSTGGTVATVGGHARHMYIPGSGAAGDNLSIQSDGTPLAGTAFSVSGSLSNCVWSSGANDDMCGIGLTNGTAVVMIGIGSNYGGQSITMLKCSTTVSCGNAPYFSLGISSSIGTPAFRITLTAGTTLTFYYSVDGGASYDQLRSDAVTAFFASSTGLNGVWGINNALAYHADSSTLLDWKLQ